MHQMVACGGVLRLLNSERCRRLYFAPSLVNPDCVFVWQVVVWILYYAPFGIFSLIMHNVAMAKDLTSIVTSMGLFVATVITGLLIQSLIVLPLIYFAFTRKFPWKVYPGFMAAFVTAFGTDSSSATLPVTMRCATEQGAHEDIVQ